MLSNADQLIFENGEELSRTVQAVEDAAALFAVVDDENGRKAILQLRDCLQEMQSQYYEHYDRRR